LSSLIVAGANSVWRSIGGADQDRVKIGEIVLDIL